MNNKKLKWSILLLFAFGIIGIKAQNQLFINEKIGTQTSFTIDEIQKITFLSDSIKITKKAGAAETYFLSDIKYLSFTDYNTAVTLPTQNVKTESISLFPIPANDQININFQSPENGLIQINIIDLHGRIVLQQYESCHRGQNKYILPISQLKRGMYLCQIISEKTIVSKKIITN